MLSDNLCHTNEDYREYGGMYGYGIGNVFLPDHIDKAFELGAEQIKYSSKDYNQSSSRAISIDPATRRFLGNSQK
jgi:hypothetical protein